MYAIPNCQPTSVLLYVARHVYISAAMFVLLFTFATFTGSQANAQFPSAGEPVTGYEIPDGNLPPSGDVGAALAADGTCLLYTSPSPRDGLLSRMPSSA